MKYIRAEAVEEEGPYSPPLGRVLTLKDIKRGHCFAGFDEDAGRSGRGSGEDEGVGGGLEGASWGLGLSTGLIAADY